MVSAAKWQIVSGRICLQSVSGETVDISAMEVFQAVYGRARVLKGFAVEDPSKALSNLSFSRFPAESCIRVFESEGQILVQAGAIANTVFVQLKSSDDQVIVNGKWFPVQTDALDVLRDWLASVNASEGPISIGALIALRTSPGRPAALIDEVTLSSHKIALNISTATKSVLGLNAELYDYQVVGVSFLRMVAEQGIGCILGDEMGLGKTLQVIALLQSEFNEGRSQSLIVAPATLLENWRREFAKFAPNLKVHIHAGSDRAGVASKLFGYDVTVTSYDTVIRDEVLFGSIDWNVVALDEAQNIKSPTAQRTNAVKNLPRRVSIAVTGTPLENRVDDLWSIADFALPGMLGPLTEFRSRYVNDMGSAERLGQVVAPIVLRRLVLDVAKDLPPKIEVPQAIKASQAFAVGYEELRKSTIAEYGSGGELVASIRLRMYCAHPKLSGAWSDDLSFEMPKYTRLLEILEEVFSVNEKALIFSTFTGMADLLAGDLSIRFPEGFFKTIDGRLPVPHRQEAVDGFFQHSGFGALVLNPKAAGVGLNITAANHVIHYNPEWNPALTDQATARAFRRKQTRPVTVHHLYFVDTVESVMIERAAFKRQLAGEAVTGHEGEVDPIVLADALKISPIEE